MPWFRGLSVVNVQELACSSQGHILEAGQGKTSDISPAEAMTSSFTSMALEPHP